MRLRSFERRHFLGLALACVAGGLAASCASPALAIYTLGTPATAAAAETAPLNSKPVVIEVRRVSIPDNLDSQDITVRDGSTLVRSARGRWAGRLSLSVTAYVTARLAQRLPDALVTDQPQVDPPNYRIFITISRLDVTAKGVATADADWLVVPRNPSQPTWRKRGRFTSTGPVATDQEVVALYRAVVSQVAGAIDVARLR
jgi:uncharacterized lipoprotein YmbA